MLTASYQVNVYSSRSLVFKFYIRLPTHFRIGLPLDFVTASLFFLSMLITFHICGIHLRYQAHRFTHDFVLPNELVYSWHTAHIILCIVGIQVNQLSASAKSSGVIMLINDSVHNTWSYRYTSRCSETHTSAISIRPVYSCLKINILKHKYYYA